MNFIKNKNPKSIRELSKLVNKDVSSVQCKVKQLEKQGLVSFKEGNENSKIPVLSYNKIEITI